MDHHPRYKISTSDHSETFEFTSIGAKGKIQKLIHFQETDNPLIYNLAFGDKIEHVIDGEIVIEIDDRVISENGDRDIVLATVVSAVYEYSSRYPDRWIIFTGSDEIRTRLYRIAITKNYKDLCKDFHIFGLDFVNDILEKVPFDSNMQFLGFIVKRQKPEE